MHISKCSGASSFAISTATERLSATIILPLLSMEVRAISERESIGICFSSCFDTALASSVLSVTSTALAILSCSACDRRSAATYAGLQVLSATTSISLGPAIISIATLPKTCRFASATYALPGPTILSTAGTVSVP